MTARVTFENGAIEVDAALIAERFGIEPGLVQAHMQDGHITSLCERGIDEDAGTYRLSFFTKHKRVRLVVDAAGNVLRISALGSPDRPLPASFRKPGA
jgi:hypothetical protein